MMGYRMKFEKAAEGEAVYDRRWYAYLSCRGVVRRLKRSMRRRVRRQGRRDERDSVASGAELLADLHIDADQRAYDECEASIERTGWPCERCLEVS